MRAYCRSFAWFADNEKEGSLARLIIESPLLDLRTLEGEKLVEGTPEELQAIRQEAGRHAVEGMRRALSTMTLIDPNIRSFAQEGLFVRFEDDGVEAECKNEHKVHVLASSDTARCGCGAPSAGYTVKQTCRNCQEKSPQSREVAQRPAVMPAA